MYSFSWPFLAVFFGVEGDPKKSVLLVLPFFRPKSVRAAEEVLVREASERLRQMKVGQWLKVSFLFPCEVLVFQCVLMSYIYYIYIILGQPTSKSFRDLNIRIVS